jgi:hypothetical protein
MVSQGMHTLPLFCIWMTEGACFKKCNSFFYMGFKMLMMLRKICDGTLCVRGVQEDMEVLLLGCVRKNLVGACIFISM